VVRSNSTVFAPVCGRTCHKKGLGVARLQARKACLYCLAMCATRTIVSAGEQGCVNGDCNVYVLPAVTISGGDS
jgi:hypothetical protein